MPALVNSNVGSFCGTSEEEWTSRCPFSMKKSRNLRRISEPVSMSVWRASTRGTGFIAETLILNHRGHRGSLRDAITRNAKSPRTCSHGYCRGHLFWVGKILKRGGCGEGPRRAQRKARNRPSPSLLDEKAQKLTADFGAGEHECLEGLNGWNGIHC